MLRTLPEAGFLIILLICFVDGRPESERGVNHQSGNNGEHGPRGDGPKPGHNPPGGRDGHRREGKSEHGVNHQGGNNGEHGPKGNGPKPGHKSPGEGDGHRREGKTEHGVNHQGGNEGGIEMRTLRKEEEMGKHPEMEKDTNVDEEVDIENTDTDSWNDTMKTWAKEKKEWKYSDEELDKLDKGGENLKELKDLMEIIELGESVFGEGNNKWICETFSDLKAPRVLSNIMKRQKEEALKVMEKLGGSQLFAMSVGYETGDEYDEVSEVEYKDDYDGDYGQDNNNENTDTEHMNMHNLEEKIQFYMKKRLFYTFVARYCKF